MLLKLVFCLESEFEARGAVPRDALSGFWRVSSSVMEATPYAWELAAKGAVATYLRYAAISEKAYEN